LRRQGIGDLILGLQIAINMSAKSWSV